MISWILTHFHIWKHFIFSFSINSQTLLILILNLIILWLIILFNIRNIQIIIYSPIIPRNFIIFLLKISLLFIFFFHICFSCIIHNYLIISFFFFYFFYFFIFFISSHKLTFLWNVIMRPISLSLIWSLGVCQRFWRN